MERNERQKCKYLIVIWLFNLNYYIFTTTSIFFLLGLGGKGGQS